MQITEGSIAYIAEGGLESVAAIDVDSQRVTVAVEDTAVGMTSITATHAGADVGKEAGVHVLTVGVKHLLAEGVPVIGRAYGEECLRQILKQIERRLIALNHKVDVVVDTGTIESDAILILRTF